MRRTLLLACLLVCLFAMPPPAAASRPVLTRLQAEAENPPEHHSFAQDGDHVLYVGSDDAVHRFDGVRWTRIALPAPGPVRSLLVDRHDRVWVGAYDRPGWLQREIDGSVRFIAIDCVAACTPADSHLADIWAMVERDEGIYLQGLYDLLLVDHQGELRRHWHNPQRFGEIADLHGRLYLQFRGEGLKVLDGEDFRLVTGGEAFAGPRIYNLFELADGAVLVHDLAPSLRVLDGNGVHALANGPPEDQLKAMLKGVRLDQRHFGFASDDGELRVLDPASGELQRWPLGEMYQSSIGADHQGGWVIADGLGLIRFGWPFDATVSNGTDGVHGDVRRFVRDGGRLWMLTSAGAYVAPLAANGSVSGRFEAKPWTTSEAWDLLPASDGLLLAESYALVRPDPTAGSQRIETADRYPRRLLRSRFDRSRLWVGGEHGIALFERADAGWVLRAELALNNELFDTLGEIDADTAVAGSERRGALRVHYDGSAVLAAQPLSDASGRSIATAGPARISALDGARNLLSIPGALYLIDGAEVTRSDLDGLVGRLPAEAVIELRSGPAGERWAFAANSLFQQLPGQDWLDLSARIRPAYRIGDLLPVAPGEALIGGPGRLLHLRSPKRAPAADRTVPLRLASVALARGGEDWELQSLVAAPRLRAGSDSIRFELAYNDLTDGQPAEFRMRVRELGDTWSPWHRSASYVTGGLAAGRYHFEAESRRDPRAPAQVLAAFEFVVDPRWHEQGWVRAAFAVLLVALGGLLVQRRNRGRLRRMRSQNRDLDQLVRARTSELETANRRLLDLAQSDGLTGVANRRRFDQVIGEWMAPAENRPRPIALVMCDVDHFKQFNDEYGHLAGDELLRRLGRVLHSQAREGTLVARYGGEEFAVLARDCDLGAARALAERLRTAVERELGGSTISIGIAIADTRCVAEDLIARADAALYAAKRGGRNRVEEDLR